MVIGRLAASILTAREPQITRKLKLPPYTPPLLLHLLLSSADRASIRRLNTLLGSYTVLPWRFGFEFSHETRNLSVDRARCIYIYFFHRLLPLEENVGKCWRDWEWVEQVSFFLSFFLSSMDRSVGGWFLKFFFSIFMSNLFVLIAEFEGIWLDISGGWRIFLNFAEVSILIRPRIPLNQA